MRYITTTQSIDNPNTFLDRIRVIYNENADVLPPFRVQFGDHFVVYVPLEDLDTLALEIEAARREYLDEKWNNAPHSDTPGWDAYVAEKHRLGLDDPDGDFSDFAQLADGDVPPDVESI